MEQDHKQDDDVRVVCAVHLFNSPAESLLMFVKTHSFCYQGSDNQGGSDGASSFEAKPEVQLRLATLAKDFEVLETLIRGYEVENKKLATAMREQAKQSKETQAALRNENARVQQQVRAVDL